MKKNILLILALILLCQYQEVVAQVVKTVVVDAGHGGKDSGTTARHQHHKHEKYISLAIAKRLGRYIEQNYPNVKVIYTRKTDVYLTLNRRAEIANKANADLFISIHVDAVGNRKIHGASVYVLGLHRSEDNLKVAMRENAVMMQEDDYQAKYAGFNPNDAESYIIFSLMQNQYLDNSMTMASFVNKYLKSETKRYTKGVKQAGFYVLREVAMPSILVETGYITNTSDANYLCSKKGQQKIAFSIFQAFRDYKNFIEKHTTDLTEVAKKAGVEEEGYFTVQLLYSGKDIRKNSRTFKGLSPILRNGKRYCYGKTSSYTEGLKLQREARKSFADAYLIGFYKGEKVSVSKLRRILKRRK
ncbi:MAG: N-acetylmuramoyl-L-alanine amidase [Flavobacteriaceae bacterium]|nr:N-acetylmuramoyl-L-alanine amidase [Flavobacteriaceae bacterium]